MSLTGMKKSPLVALPFLTKRLRRITAMGFRNLTVSELNFTVHFTLHRTDKNVAFYTSELAENQRSPEWSYLQFPTSVQCLQDFVMRVWITSSTTCRLFLEYDVHLDESLILDGQKDDSPSSNNSLWLEMFGYRFTDNPSKSNAPKSSLPIDTELPGLEKKLKRIHVVKSYNKSSIVRMMSAIDAIRTENRLAVECLQRLQVFADEHEDYLSKIKQRETRHIRVEHLQQCLQSQRAIYERQNNSNQQRPKIIYERRHRLDQNLVQLVHHQKELNLRINELNQSKFLLHDLIKLTTFRQKEIINEIYHHVYPITKDSKNEYSIANLKLPAAQDGSYQVSLTRERENEIGAAVGYCAHFVLIISQFLQLPPRFPIDYHGASAIRIYDHTLPSNDFPLYPSYDTNLFQYGFFLLNRNIGQLMYHCRVGGRYTDYRKTLANLKELMEQYFDNAKNQQQIQLYTFNQQSMETSTSDSNMTMNERTIMRTKSNLTVSSTFSSPHSVSSSFIESNDVNRNEDDDRPHPLHLFSATNTISPRLAMQFSVQPAEQ